MGSLDGRHILITGAAQGVGEAIAHRCQQAGAAALVLVDRNEAGLAHAAHDLRGAGAEVFTLCGDLGDHGFVESVVPRAVDLAGSLDALANAAGVATRTPLLDSDLASWDDLFAVNARAPYFLMRDLVRHCVDAAKPGSIVNISSMNAKRGIPELPVYSATKAALDALTRNIAHGFADKRIRANAIQVGWADTPGERQLQARLGQSDGWLDAMAAEQPFGRLLSADDVARLAVFLLGDDSYPMTGSVIDQEQVVAGGR